MAGLYVHIPFCRSRCRYCSFNSYMGLEGLIPRYVSALIAEAQGWAGAIEVDTIYFGGGTPSLLSAGQLGDILGALRRAFVVDPGAEITVEVNPGTASAGSLAAMRALGVNRVSLGVQSLDDRELGMLGRIHTAAEAVAAFEMARGSFDNVSIDLLYGLPGQGLGRWRRTLERALGLGPEHLSLYPLSVEEGTPLAQAIAQGRMSPPDADLAAEMYQLAEEALGAYCHYELSNWARPGRECRHNLAYWYNLPYLGLGAGAHSCLGGSRFHNVASPREYIARVAGEVPGEGAIAGSEPIAEALEMAETMILGLRLEEGVGLDRLALRFGGDAVARYRSQIDELKCLGLLEEGEGHVRLTARGRLLGNEAFLRFLP